MGLGASTRKQPAPKASAEKPKVEAAPSPDLEAKSGSASSTASAPDRKPEEKGNPTEQASQADALPSSAAIGSGPEQPEGKAQEEEPAKAEEQETPQTPEKSPGGATPELVQAVEDEDWDKAAKILRERPDACDPDARTTDWDYSLMRAAAEEGAIEVCRLLLERKADVNARDQNNMTPLMGCIVGGDYPDIVPLLLEARADAAAVTDDGFTALKWATRLNRDEAIRLLREAGMTGDATCF